MSSFVMEKLFNFNTAKLTDLQKGIKTDFFGTIFRSLLLHTEITLICTEFRKNDNFAV